MEKGGLVTAIKIHVLSSYAGLNTRINIYL
jgi:hypothetical protein